MTGLTGKCYKETKLKETLPGFHFFLKDLYFCQVMKLTVKLLLLIFVDLFLLISVDQVWFDASLKVVKNSETTTTTLTKNFDNDTKKNKLNDAPAKNVLKVLPPKVQQFLPSVWIYTTAHREVVSQNLI